jgi:hypothetical protein
MGNSDTAYGKCGKYDEALQHGISAGVQFTFEEFPRSDY